jgi:Cu/Ag efflux protein CusF
MKTNWLALPRDLSRELPVGSAVRTQTNPCGPQSGPYSFWAKPALPAALLALTLTGCGGGVGDTREADKDYELKGKVVAVATDHHSVTLDHEDIPGLMKAMKMEFRVADPKLLNGLSPGDRVRGRLKAGSGNYVVTRLEKQ